MRDTQIDFGAVRADPRLAVRLPRALALRKSILPLAELEGCVHLATVSTTDDFARQSAARSFAPLKAIWHVVDAAQLRVELARLYGSADPSAADDDPVAQMDAVFRAARLRGASDIHFNPLRDGLEVRFRVDGVLEAYRTFPEAERPALVNRVKILAGLDIAERRSPQDGGFTLPATKDGSCSAVDVRVATLPVKYGERVTLRLLATERANLSLETLGMRAGQLAELERVLDSPHGLLLLTGPTGSGKSTTLYAAIRRLLSRAPLNVLTVEDPIEYEIDGALQAEVDSADKVNFGKALRSLLRHDPDVVMIGEIRDGESLDVAVKAALTGHLVLSTLHTNSALGAVTRLRDMGLDAHLVAATLRMSIAQRLVRRLCPQCREKAALATHEAALLRLPSDASAFAPHGCLACAGRGYVGRTALFELFAPDAEAVSAIAAGVPEVELRASLQARGYETLLDDARAKVLDGTTSSAEVARVIG